MVWLVGAGPGAPDLITVRGLRALQQADVVLADRLVGPEFRRLVRDDAEWIDVGKAPRDPDQTPQERIHELLVQYGRTGANVVRLKGGDPYVYGRGGEEADVLRGADIPFEVVPGITSAIAGPGAAGIPVTHRGIANAFGVFSGHEAAGKTEDTTPWAAAALLPTAVFLMGVESLPKIVENLLREGRAPETPVAVVSRATLPSQQEVRGTLATIVSLAEGIEAPAVTIVGEVVAR